MKTGRQNIILEIISQQNIETQNQLLAALQERGVTSTQATLSRDIRELRLYKETGADGRVHYVKPAEAEERTADTRLQKILRECVVSFEPAQNILVLKTLPGLASAACSAFDGMEIPGLVGTLAGDDTAFLAMKNNEYAEAFYESVEELLN